MRPEQKPKMAVVEECPVRVSAYGVGALVRRGVDHRGRTPDGVDLRVTRVDGAVAQMRANYLVPTQGGLTRHRETTLTLGHREQGCCRRWLLVCDGCGRCCAELFAPQEAAELACRVCWGLTYRSRQSRSGRLNDLYLREMDLWDRLGRACSPQRRERLLTRIERVSARRRRETTRPFKQMVSILDGVVSGAPIPA